MLDLKLVREQPDEVAAALARKGVARRVIDDLLSVDGERRRLQTEADALRARQKKAGQVIARASGEEKEAAVAEMRTVKEDLERLTTALAGAEEKVREALLEIPNLPHESVPPGVTEEDNEVVEVVGEPRVPEPLRDHQELGVSLGILDLDRGAKVSGSRFGFVLGDGALLELALIRLAFDLLVPRGFLPVYPPVLVRESAMYGTGFFPTDRAQIYETAQDDLYLVGTSEVPLAAMHADEVLDAGRLPLRYLGVSTCFRREAGTYGRDTRGIFRVHQFDKVEMFSFTRPEDSWVEHELLLTCERELFDALGLAYRVVNVCGGELGAPAAKKYDVEAWLPSEGTYREATSASNCTDYQARRLKVRMRTPDGLVPVHTLNGTAVAIGRTLTFLLEQHQQPDGSVRVPSALTERGAPEVLRPR